MQPIQAIFRPVLFRLALAGAAAAADSGPPRSPTQARSAHEFVDSIGVNTHFNYERTVYAQRFDEVKRRLFELGVRHVRDEALSEPRHPGAVARYRLLAAAGVKFCLLCFEHPASRPGPPLEEKLSTLATHLSASLAYIEGHNEPDGSWPDKANWAAGSTAHIKRIRDLARADPRLAHLPIAGSAVAHPERPAVRAAMREQNLTAIVDVANMHPYSGGTPNESRIERRLQEAREFYQNPRIIATEVGYHTAVQNKPGGHEPVTEEGRAIYLPRLLMENFRLGIERSYIYQLADSRPPNLTDIESLFGLLTHEAKPTPHYDALKNLIAILRDEGAGDFTPGSLSFAIASPPEGLRTVLLQKSGGAFYLALWRPLKIYDQIKRMDLPVDERIVSLAFASSIATAREFVPNASPQPVRTLQNITRLDVTLDARLRILELRPAATPVAVRAGAGRASGEGLGKPALVAAAADAEAVAWLRFVGAPFVPDSVPFHWYRLPGGTLRLALEVRPQAGDALEFNWGPTANPRQAVLVVNGHPVSLEAGAHANFQWFRLPLAGSLPGERYEIEFRHGPGPAPFIGEVRLTRPGADPGRPKITEVSQQAKLLESPLHGAAADADAFPEMRRSWFTPSRIPTAVASSPSRRALLEQAERNSRLANEAFFRSRRFVDGWLAQADPATGLIPRDLHRSRDYWNGRDCGADNYPFMVLTAAMTDRPLFEGRMREMLRTETRLTSRVGRLPDDYSFAKGGWRREQVNFDAIAFDGAEYVKDGLLPIAEWLGESPWSQRMIGIIDDLWERAPVDTPHGRIPTRNIEVCGDLLQANSRLYWFTGERKYLEWAARLGDYFLLGSNHPTRDFKRLRLIDHGCEVLNGLSELYFAVSRVWPEKKQAYERPLHEMFDCILAKARNDDGLLYSWFDPKTGEHSPPLCDTWGYDYDGFYTLWLVDRTPAYRDAVRKVLGNLEGRYVGACWEDICADGFADSIEGALNLLNREPMPAAARWIDTQIRMMWAIQKSDGVIEAWWGDGNFARTSLMYALWKTQGVTIEPWRADVRFGAVREGDALHVVLVADRPWAGRVVFDPPRHKLRMRLPLDYPRINQFPEWFTVAPGTRYAVGLDEAPPVLMTGAELANGVSMTLAGGQIRRMEVKE